MGIFNAKWARDTALGDTSDFQPLVDEINERILEAVAGQRMGISVEGQELPPAVVNHFMGRGFLVSVGVFSNTISWAGAVSGEVVPPTQPPEPLSMTGTTPEDGSTDVNALGSVSFSFDRPVSPGVEATVTGLSGDNSGVAVTTGVSGNNVTVTFSQTLAENGDTVTVTLDRTTIAAADDGGTIAVNPTLTFELHTFVPEPLTYTGSTPANGATEVASRNTVTLNFDRALSSTVNTGASIAGAAGVTVSSTNVSGSTVVVTLSGSLVGDGSTVTVTLPAGAVTAQDGGTLNSPASTSFTMLEPEPEPDPEPE